ncbi:MAG: hypothetical protein IJP54_03530 [Synergistaceae bacterium]|nr:hypothetical protein [Synergistaceae bacterium]MBR0034727.1 hypothetical protein [Synergistaceae bacterium]
MGLDAERVLAQVGSKANNVLHVTAGEYITYVLVAGEPEIFLMEAEEIKMMTAGKIKE